MKKFLKWSGIVVFILIVIVMIYAFLGLKETTNLIIKPVSLELVQDGTYIGNYNCYRWTNRVGVTVKEHRIVQIQPLKIQDGRQRLVNELIDKVISEQRTNVDVVSGATADSNAFLKAIELALTNGK